MDKQKFSKRLTMLREEAGLTQGELADHVKLSRSAIGMYEQGRRAPDFDAVDALAEFFDVGLSYMIGVSDNRNKYPRHEEGVMHNLTVVTRNPELVDLDEAYGHASEETRYAVRMLLGMEPYDPEQVMDMRRSQK